MKTILTVNIGLCGFGTVGQGVWKHLQHSRAELTSRLGANVEVTRIAVKDLKKKRSVKVPVSKLTEDALEIANDPSIHVVCELIGGTTLARKVTLAALKNGKIVVSANKALICDHGAEILKLHASMEVTSFLKLVSLVVFQLLKPCVKA